jgi:hypothetical protein
MFSQSDHHQYFKILWKLWEALATNSMIILSKYLQNKQKTKKQFAKFLEMDQVKSLKYIKICLNLNAQIRLNCLVDD